MSTPLPAKILAIHQARLQARVDEVAQKTGLQSASVMGLVDKAHRITGGHKMAMIHSIGIALLNMGGQ